MTRLDSDHVNWVLVVILVVLALLLALVQSSAYGGGKPGDIPPASRADHSHGTWRLATQEKAKELAPAEAWYLGRELYKEGSFGAARAALDRVVSVYPLDPAARMWAGMAAYRLGDRTGAIRNWKAALGDEARTSELGIWPAIALAAAQLEEGRVDEAARLVVPMERGDFGPGAADHAIVLYYAALVYERLAIAAPRYRDAVEESLAERFSPALAGGDGSRLVSPNSQSWLIFLAKRTLQRTIRAARTIDWTAPVIPESATVEPSLAPNVEELLEVLGSADFAAQAHQKLRALKMYESTPDRQIEIFDDPETLRRGRLIA